jgi:uncharacterized membrane protein YkvA (DUF1232 family)
VKPNRWLNSWAYRKAKKLVSETIKSPKRLFDLVASGQNKVASDASGRLLEIKESISTAFRLIKSYAAGEWRDISVESFMLIVTSIIYLVMPIDAIPDFLLSLGFLDDAALLVWTFRSVADDFERFRLWEAEQRQKNSIEPDD